MQPRKTENTNFHHENISQNSRSRHRFVAVAGDGEAPGGTDVLPSGSLGLLYDRSCLLAEGVSAGSVGLLDAVDMAYSAAELAGLVDRYGDDAVQAVLAKAFTGAAR